jgi:FKBP-type peptidyl-prolyl cis-trans isomerase
MGRRNLLYRSEDKARFVIPSDLGYGPAEFAGGVMNSPSYFDFDVEINGR